MRYISAGFNGSECSMKAVLHARDMAERTGARLHVLTIASFPRVSCDLCMDNIMEQEISHCEQLIESLNTKLGTSERMQLLLRVGNPALEIANHAKEYGVGQIVIGCRRQWFERWPASHVARQIIALAPCAVIVIGNARPARRLPEKEPVAWEAGI
jgi:nucleotide-binding universal stress UspA family protein